MSNIQDSINIIQSAIDCASDVGARFTMEDVAARSGTDAATLSALYPDKTALLRACLQWVEKLLFPGPDADMQNLHTPEDLRTLWMQCMDRLLAHKAETAFYYTCTNMQNFEDAFPVCESEAFSRNCTQRCRQIYVRDVSVLFAHKILLGFLQDTPEVRDSIWALFSGGLSSLF